jgi:signal transduction histidine kinase
MINIESMADMLSLEPRKGDRLRSLVSETQEAAQHAIGVIRRLRKLLKGGSEGESEELDLAEGIQDAVHILQPEATQRGLNLAANGIASPLSVRADRIHLQQLIFNLSNNAIHAIGHAASTHRVVKICAAARELCHVEVSIGDCGAGIPHDQLGAVFETFYTTKKEGTGLGLSIAHTLIENYGGNIWAENCAEGVRFFVLPCRWFAGHAMRKHCDRTGIPEATSLLVWVKHADSARPNQSQLCVNNEAGRS